MNTTTSSALDRLPAAEASLVSAINAAASTLDTIATGTVDAALERLELAARACHGRLALAMGTLSRTVGEVVATMEAMAEGIFEDLSTEDHIRRVGIDPTTLAPL